MRSTNDYIKLTKGYLENALYLEQALKNIESDVREMEQELNGIPIAISRLSPEPGGSSELTTVEQLAYLREGKAESLNRLRLKQSKIRNHLAKLNESITLLNPEERKTIRLIYFEGLRFVDTAEEMNLSERSCRRRVGSAIEHLALMLFGYLAKEDVFFLH